MRKEKSDQNAVAELTREGLYKENKWLWEENQKLRDDLNRIEEIKDKERMKMVKRLSELEEEVEKKDRLVKVRMKKWKEK